MPLPGTGPITSEMIRTQYGGSLPFRLFDYYRGGARVPNTAANSNVPTSGPISFLNFLGQGGSSGGSSLAANGTSPAQQSDYVPGGSASKVVTASGSVFPSGGTGSYSCTWSHFTGSTAISTPGANNFNPSFSASVPAGTIITATKRCTISDGASSTVYDMAVELSYVNSA